MICRFVPIFVKIYGQCWVLARGAPEEEQRSTWNGSTHLNWYENNASHIIQTDDSIYFCCVARDTYKYIVRNTHVVWNQLFESSVGWFRWKRKLSLSLGRKKNLMYKNDNDSLFTFIHKIHANHNKSKKLRHARFSVQGEGAQNEERN